MSAAKPAARRTAAERMAAALQPVPAPTPVAPVDAAPQEPAAGGGRRRPAAVQTKTTRITADLSPLEYRALTRVLADLAEMIGVHKVTTVDLIRSMVDELGEDLRQGAGPVVERVADRLAARMSE
ncbi:hypothetical protein OG559_31055 (plasmid) [Micromonospora sp. NBC_01405]|uniref:hypothetical protein n=1 Tax=Micromonospora sp. NBC_01405 TaxID=2903589 RepID=UPI00324CD218